MNWRSLTNVLLRLGPYQSLLMLSVPFLIVEPLKVGALFIIGGGHWLLGPGMLITAYAASVLVVERLFKILKPKLMRLGWFRMILHRIQFWRAGPVQKVWARPRSRLGGRWPRNNPGYTLDRGIGCRQCKTEGQA